MPNRRRETRENHEYAAMLRRMVKGYGRRLSMADPDDLVDLLAIQAQIDLVIGQAVASMRADSGFSWAEIARPLGVTRQAAQMRWGKYAAPAVDADDAKARLADL